MPATSSVRVVVQPRALEDDGDEGEELRAHEGLEAVPAPDGVLEQLRAQGEDWKVERVAKELQELEHEVHEFDALPAPDKLAVARGWTPEKGWKKYRDFMALVDVEKSDAQVEADKESVMQLVRFNFFCLALQ